MKNRKHDYIPGDEPTLLVWLNNFRKKLLEILEILGLIRQVGGAIAGGGTTKNLAQGPFTPDIQIKAKNDSTAMVGISIGLAATPTTFIEPAITGGKVVGFGEEKTFRLSELGTGDYLNMTNPYLDAGSLQVSIASEQVLELNSSIMQLVPAINNVLIKKTDLKQAVDEKDALELQIISGKLRPFIQKKIKANDAYTDAIGDDLGIIGEEISIDPATAKPILTPSKVPQGWRLGFNLHGFFDGVNIYRKLPAQPAFIKLAYDSSSPYIDTDAIQNGTQYYAYYVIKDVETGQQSDITIIQV